MPLRPDVTLKAGGQTLVLRPSFEALDAIERRTGAGIPQLMRRWFNGEIRFGDSAVILEETARAAGGTLKAEAAQELVQSHFKQVSEAIADLLSGAFGPAPEVQPQNPTP